LPGKPIKRYSVGVPRGPGAFQSSPSKLDIPLSQLREKYQGEQWDAFEKWAQATQVEPGRTVMQWLEHQDQARPARQVAPVPAPAPVVPPAPPVAPLAPAPTVPTVAKTIPIPVVSSPAPAKPKAPSQPPKSKVDLPGTVAALKTSSGASVVAFKAPNQPKLWGKIIPSKAGQAAHAKALSDAYADMRKRFPNMPAAPTAEILVVDSKRGRAHLDGPRPSLATKAKDYYTPEWIKRLEDKEKAKGGPITTERPGTVVADNFRHELAHNLTTPTILADWEQQVMTVHDFDWFRKNISDYAALDKKSFEALAESFSTCTRPGYKRGGLPVIVEGFIFKKMLGEP
jgi:hypothetical protein